MMPRPDHGATRDRGSGRLASCRALITGGDSGMGRAAAITFAREGAEVVIGYLPPEQSDAEEVTTLIRHAGGKVLLLPGSIRLPEFCRKLRADTWAGGHTRGKLVSFGEDAPMGRPGQPAERAPLYVALADPMLNDTTAQTFGAVGGKGGF